MLNTLFSQRSNPFPTHIDFTTFRNRALRAYWIWAFSIKAKEAKAHIVANYKRKKINISAHNITGLSIFFNLSKI